jgi:hypothetical protein
VTARKHALHKRAIRRFEFDKAGKERLNCRKGNPIGIYSQNGSVAFSKAKGRLLGRGVRTSEPRSQPVPPFIPQRFLRDKSELAHLRDNERRETFAAKCSARRTTPWTIAVLTFEQSPSVIVETRQFEDSRGVEPGCAS